MMEKQFAQRKRTGLAWKQEQILLAKTQQQSSHQWHQIVDEYREYKELEKQFPQMFQEEIRDIKQKYSTVLGKVNSIQRKMIQAQLHQMSYKDSYNRKKQPKHESWDNEIVLRVN